MILRNLWRKDATGQALVEMAIGLLLLFTIVFGITEFGRAMYTKNTLTNAARAGARQAAVTQGLTNDSAALNDNCTYGTTGNDPVFQKVCDSLFAGIKPKSQVTVVIEGGSGSGGAAATNDAIKVTVRYGTSGNPTTGFQSFVPKLIPIGNVLVGEATMRFEY